MSYLNTTLNITRDIYYNENNSFDYTNLRDAIKIALQDNFYNILSRNKIEPISDLVSDINGTVTSDTNVQYHIWVSRDENVIKLVDLANNEIASITYEPYVSYIKYTQWYNSVTKTTENKYKTVGTILLNIIIDQYICGFSILNPADLQVVDAQNNVYTIKNNINKDSYISAVDYENETLNVIQELPEYIKLQTSIINDVNSYYEIKINTLDDLYNTITVPCVDSTVYIDNNGYSFKSLFNDLGANFTVDTINDTSIIGTVLMNNKILVNTTTNTIQAFSPTIFDTPDLDVSSYWIQDADLNVGDSIVVGDSDYLISDKNTLIQLANTEIYGINRNVIYDGKPHFIDIVYPQGAKVQYRLSGTSTWNDFPANPSTVTDYVNAQNYVFDYKVEVVPTDSTIETKKEYYGQVTLNILTATQYGYFVNAFSGDYDALPHSVIIYTDANVEYSADGVNWATTAPIFTNVGNHTVYYKLTKANYTTVIETVDVIINTITDIEALNFGIDISSNIIVMREQLYSNVPSNLFLMSTDNKVYISDNEPTNINVNNFTGKFPDAKSQIPVTETLGTFTLSPDRYYMVLECYLPWYYQGKEPTVDNTATDLMLGNIVNFTVDYTNDPNPTDDSNWINIDANKTPSNGFYQYKVTDITLPDNPVGMMWGRQALQQAATKRIVFKMDLSETNAGEQIKTIRIKCTHTGNVRYNSSTSLPEKDYIDNENLGISIITFADYSTPNAIIYNNETVETNIYSLATPKFKSALTSSAFFSYNVGYNMELSGCGELNIANVDSTTGLYDTNADIVWRSGDSSSVTEPYKVLWTSTQPYRILKDSICRIQFNSDKLSTADSSIIKLTNTDKIYAYLPCNS